MSANGTISTIAGTGVGSYAGDGGMATLAAIGGLSLEASLYAAPLGLAVDSQGNLYISDTSNRRVRILTTDGNINTIAGNGVNASTGDSGPATSAGLAGPAGIAIGGNGIIDVADSTAVRVLTPNGMPVHPGPSLASGGVIGASAFGATAQLAVGSWVEIHGNYLAPDSRSWGGTDFNGLSAPTSLDGTSVTIGGQSAFVSYISPGQVNVQVPTTIGSGAQQLILTTTYGKTGAYIATVNGVLPRILAPPSFTINSVPYVVALFPDNATYVLPTGAIPGVSSAPAKAGDTITLYGIGFGSVTPGGAAGQIVQLQNALDLPLNVKIGGISATISYAGLAPAMVGLYQFNVVVPKLSFTGIAPLSFTLGGGPGAQTLYLAVQ